MSKYTVLKKYIYKIEDIWWICCESNVNNIIYIHLNTFNYENKNTSMQAILVIQTKLKNKTKKLKFFRA